MSPIKNKITILAGLVLAAAASCRGTPPGVQAPREEDAKAMADAKNGNEAAVPEVKSQFAAWQRVEEQLKKIKPVELKWNKDLVKGKDREALGKLLVAARVMDDLFLAQADLRSPQTKIDLEKTDDPKGPVMLHYFKINFGPFDRFDEMRPFINVPRKPDGATFYPLNMDKSEFEGWVATHPKQKEAFVGNFTIISRDKDGLAAVPYSQFYKKDLEKAAQALNEAAALTENASLKKYLASRAKALLSNDYYQSDVDWMDVKDNLLDVTIGPYETYEDALYGYKAAFEAFLGVRDPEQSRQLEKIRKFLPEMEAALPLDTKYKGAKGGGESPVSVIDIVYTAGDARAGINSIAFNLPNDERVRKAKGSKKVLLRNIISAKAEGILLPIADILIDPGQRPMVTKEQFFNHTLLHEISHGIGPGFITKDGRKTEVRIELKDLYSTVEEAKADVLGMTEGIFLMKKGFYPPETREQIWVTFLANIFRSVRFGLDEAHGKANALILNYALGEGGYERDAASGTYRVNFDKIASAMEKLAGALLTIEATGDYQGAKDLIDKYGALTGDEQAALAKISGVPVDVEAVFDLDF